MKINHSITSKISTLLVALKWLSTGNTNLCGMVSLNSPGEIFLLFNYYLIKYFNYNCSLTHFNIKNLLEALRVRSTLKKISLQLGLCNYDHFKRLGKVSLTGKCFIQIRMMEAVVQYCVSRVMVSGMIFSRLQTKHSR